MMAGSVKPSLGIMFPSAGDGSNGMMIDVGDY